MKIAILGAGFSGLSVALRLLLKGHQVTIFEKEDSLGGLAIGFTNPKWQWSLEKAYHHWFTNDDAILSLARQLNHPVIIKRPSTEVLINDQKLPFDSAISLLKFPNLSIIDRLRVAFVLLYLKLTKNYQKFAGQRALPWIKSWMGDKATKIIWEPLLGGKFGQYKNEISLIWFWARIKKRTPKLAYPEGGFKVFADKLGREIEKNGGKIYLNTTVSQLKSIKNGCEVITDKGNSNFDKVIVTLPSPIFAKITPGLPNSYIKRIASIPHLHAQVMILVLKKPFMNGTYWLNITDKTYPFLVLVEHTNFMDPKNYGNQHIIYIGNYLPTDHPYLKMTSEELLKVFDPYLKKINPTYQQSLISHHLFVGPYAQPIVTTDYPKLKPSFKTPLKNIYLANLDMVYPWDRGTNYAVELGEKVAKVVTEDEFSKD